MSERATIALSAATIALSLFIVGAQLAHAIHSDCSYGPRKELTFGFIWSADPICDALGYWRLP